MRYSTKIGLRIGAKAGIASVIGYSLIDTAFNNIVIIFVWHPTIARFLQGLLLDFINHTVFLIIPFAIICSITGSIFANIVVAHPSLTEKRFASISILISLVIALFLYASTATMIYNINPETVFMANLEFRTIPYTLYIVWGYFVSKKIYRAVTDAKSSSS